MKLLFLSVQGNISWPFLHILFLFHLKSAHTCIHTVFPTETAHPCCLLCAPAFIKSALNIETLLPHPSKPLSCSALVQETYPNNPQWPKLPSAWQLIYHLLTILVLYLISSFHLPQSLPFYCISLKITRFLLTALKRLYLSCYTDMNWWKEGRSFQIMYFHLQICQIWSKFQKL